MYLKAHSSLSANGLVLKLWVYRTKAVCSNYMLVAKIHRGQLIVILSMIIHDKVL